MVVTGPAARLTLAEWLRAAYAGPEAGCPPPEAFLAEELDVLEPDQRRRLEAHAEGCPACAAERALAAAFDATAELAPTSDVDWVVAKLRGEPAAGNPPPRRQVVLARGGGWSTWGRLAAAAVLVLAAGLTFQRLYPGAPTLPAPPRGSTGVLRGAEVELLAPLGEVASTPRELRWQAAPGASAYRMRLVMVDGTMLWESEVSEPRADLPAEVASRLHEGVSYQWAVEALEPDGRVVGKSALARFRVRPAPEEP